jgi:hypothetical protein
MAWGINVVRKQRVKLVCFASGYVAEDVFEPKLRINFIEFATSKEAVEHGRTFGTLMGSGKEVVLSSQGTG